MKYLFSTVGVVCQIIYSSTYVRFKYKTDIQVHIMTDSWQTTPDIQINKHLRTLII